MTTNLGGPTKGAGIFKPTGKELPVDLTSGNVDLATAATYTLKTIMTFANARGRTLTLPAANDFNSVAEAQIGFIHNGPPVRVLDDGGTIVGVLLQGTGRIWATSISDANGAWIVDGPQTFGPHVDNPLYLPHKQGESVSITNNNGAARTADQAAFFDAMAEDSTRGTAVDTTWSSDTYKDIYERTGQGVIYYFIGPERVSASETTTIEFNRDGVVTEVPITVATANYRAVWGNTAQYLGLSGNLESFARNYAGYGSPLSVQHYNTWNVPGLQYNGYIKIRAKHSAAQSTAIDQECGVLHEEW